MSLEQAIADLTAEVRVLTETLKAGGIVASTPAAAKKEKRAPKEDTSPVAEAPAPVAAPVFTPTEPPASAPSEMQFAEAQTRLAQVAQRLGSPARVIEVMQTFGGPPLTSIKPESYAELVMKAEALQ